jgi:hypothetical protein
MGRDLHQRSPELEARFFYALGRDVQLAVAMQRDIYTDNRC